MLIFKSSWELKLVVNTHTHTHAVLRRTLGIPCTAIERVKGGIYDTRLRLDWREEKQICEFNWKYSTLNLTSKGINDKPNLKEFLLITHDYFTDILNKINYTQ